MNHTVGMTGQFLLPEQFHADDIGIRSKVSGTGKMRGYGLRKRTVTSAEFQYL